MMEVINPGSHKQEVARSRFEPLQPGPGIQVICVCALLLLLTFEILLGFFFWEKNVETIEQLTCMNINADTLIQKKEKVGRGCDAGKVAWLERLTQQGLVMSWKEVARQWRSHGWRWNNESQPPLRAWSVPGAVHNLLRVCEFSGSSPWGRNYFQPHFTDEKTETQNKALRWRSHSWEEWSQSF